jgi:hypothetical protein
MRLADSFHVLFTSIQKSAVGAGMSWFVSASPVKTRINGESLYHLSTAVLGAPRISPAQE